MVSRLERAGFVRRVPCTTDRRTVIVEPTAASQALRREVEKIWRDLERITVADLSDAERTSALRALEHMEHNLVGGDTGNGGGADLSWIGSTPPPVMASTPPNTRSHRSR